MPKDENNSFKIDFRILDNINSPPHVHIEPEIEIMILLEGSAECTIYSQHYKFQKGDIAFFSQYQIHGYSNSDNVVALLLIFNHNYIKEFYDFFSEHIIESPILKGILSTSNISTLLDCMISDYNSKIDNNILNSYIRLLVFKLIGYLKLNKRTVNLQSNFLIRAQDYCKTHYAQNITVHDIAKAVNVNPNYLSNKFSKTFKTSLIDYLNSYRITKACEILKLKNSSITDVAFSCGFRSIRTFNREFSKKIQMTPTEYRNSV